MEETGCLLGEWWVRRQPWARFTSDPLRRSVGGSGGQASREGGSFPVASGSSLVSRPDPRQASILSHRWGNELQLEVLILEDAVESRATLGATERPVALTAAVLGEFCKESQLQRRGHTSA